MRRATPRHRGRGEIVHRVARRRLAVIRDDRRMFVERAEIQSPAAILRRVQRHHRRAQCRPRRLPARSRILDLRRHRATLTRQRQPRPHGVFRHLLGDRPALRRVRLQDRRIGPARQHPRQHPGQIGRIRDSGVHAVAGERHPDMRGVATDEHAPVAEPVGQQAPPDPILLAQHRVVEVRPHPQDQPYATIAVHRVEAGLLRPQIVVDQPGLAPVDREHVGAAPRVQRLRRPRRLRPHPPDQRRRTDVAGLRAPHLRVACQCRPDLPPDLRVPAVAAHHIDAGDLQRLAAIQIFRRRHHAIGRLREPHHTRAIEQGHAVRRSGVIHQQRLQIDLVDPVRRFRRRPPRVRAARRRVTLGPARDRDARELDPGGRGAERDVVRVIRRQPGIAHRPRHAQAAEDLHRSCGDMIALHAGRLAARAQFRHRHVDATPRQVHRQRDADRPGADDQNLGEQPARHQRTFRLTGIAYTSPAKGGRGARLARRFHSR